uniref:Uncharacterized protein n=1 Tax=Anguilla anguilla TaxID=7936 RepID=A0A0E9UJS0_ANGAN
MTLAIANRGCLRLLANLSIVMLTFCLVNYVANLRLSNVNYQTEIMPQWGKCSGVDQLSSVTRL